MEVREGEVVHLRGPNGAGKTSLLKVLAGLLPVHSGEATVLGRDLVVDRRAVRREVGMLGHESFLYEELTVEENLRFAVRAARGSERGIGPALEQFGFGGRLASTTVGRCSAGQQRRAALAVLVARRARLWLLDEPHAGLDQDGRDLFDGLLAGSKLAGRTVIFSSHEHERAESLADRAVHLAGGRVIEPPVVRETSTTCEESAEPGATRALASFVSAAATDGGSPVEPPEPPCTAPPAPGEPGVSAAPAVGAPAHVA